MGISSYMFAIKFVDNKLDNSKVRKRTLRVLPSMSYKQSNRPDLNRVEEGTFCLVW